MLSDSTFFSEWRLQRALVPVGAAAQMLRPQPERVAEPWVTISFALVEIGLRVRWLASPQPGLRCCPTRARSWGSAPGLVAVVEQQLESAGGQRVELGVRALGRFP